MSAVSAHYSVPYAPFGVSLDASLSSTTVSVSTGGVDEFYDVSLNAGTYSATGIYVLTAQADSSYNCTFLTISGVSALGTFPSQCIKGIGTTSALVDVANAGLVSCPINTVFQVIGNQASLRFSCTSTFSGGSFQRTAYLVNIVKLA